jgi:hypothetical protein
MKNKVYQPSVIEKANYIIESLNESNFFTEHDINDKTFAFELLCEKLTEKFIIGELETEDGLFQEDEMEQILTEIIVGTHLNSLMKKGLVDSIEDENGEEVFFLTEFGKNEAVKILEKNK